MLVDRIKEKQRKQLEDYQKLLDQKTFEYAYSLKLNENQNNPNKISQSESISSFIDKNNRQNLFGKLRDRKWKK